MHLFMEISREENGSPSLSPGNATRKQGHNEATMSKIGGKCEKIYIFSICNDISDEKFACAHVCLEISLKMNCR